MRESKSEKYLVDIIQEKGGVKATLEDRCTRAKAATREILSILNEVPLGKARVQMGLQLRDSMFLNGILFNAEAWHNLSLGDYKKLEVCDNKLLRGILRVGPGTPTAFLHLETGTKPLRFTIRSRRLNYFRHIVTREPNEMIAKVYRAQLEAPNKGDWTELVKEDFETIGEQMNEADTITRTKKQNSQWVKQKLNKKALDELISQRTKKMDKLEYDLLEIQKYLVDDEVSETQCDILIRLRSHGTDHKQNRKTQYSRDEDLMKCPLQCEGAQADTQEHVFICDKMSDERNKLKTHNDVVHDWIYSSPDKQKKAAELYLHMMEARQNMLNV